METDFMKDNLVLQDKIFISARRVHELFGYTSDYVGQLCRAGKLECTMVGRSWFVTEKSIINHRSVVHEVLKNKGKEKRREIKKLYRELSQSKVITLSAAPVAVEVPVEVAPRVSQVSYPVFSDIPAPKVSSVNVSKLRSTPALRVPMVASKKTSSSLKIFSALVLASVVLFFAFNFFATKDNPLADINPGITASLASVSEDIINSISRGFNRLTNSFAEFVSRRHLGFNDTKNHETIPDQTMTRGVAFNGVVVVPAHSTSEKNEALEKKIRDSFSDEVIVSMDQDQNSGIITPVFKKSQGEDFLYVIVPVEKSP